MLLKTINKTSANLEPYTVRDSLCQLKESHQHFIHFSFYLKTFSVQTEVNHKGFPNYFKPKINAWGIYNYTNEVFF